MEFLSALLEELNLLRTSQSILMSLVQNFTFCLHMESVIFVKLLKNVYCLCFKLSGNLLGKYAYHTDRISSDQKFDFNQQVRVPIAQKLVADSEQLEVGSFEKNEWQLSWTDAGDFTDFVFRTKLVSGTNVWTAFALSKDKKMVFYSKPN